MPSGHGPSPDPEDHLTLKKLKTSHSRESKSQTQILVQTSIPAQSNLNIPPILLQPIIPPAIPTVLFEVVNVEDSDEEQNFQSLQANIFNEISSLPNQTPNISTSNEAELSVQPTAEQPIMHTAEVQTESIIAEQTTDMLPEQQPAKQILEQPTPEQITIPSTSVPETSSSEQQTKTTTVEDLPCTPPDS